MGWDFISPDDGQHRSYGSGGGTDMYFTLEARATVVPALIGPMDIFGVRDFILTDRWQRVPVQRSTCGVPVEDWNLPSDAIAQTHDLFNYEAAAALAHLFVAQLAAPALRGIRHVEVRLVKVQLEYSFKTIEIGVGEIINRSGGPSPYHAFTKRETTPIPLSARSEKSLEPSAHRIDNLRLVDNKGNAANRRSYQGIENPASKISKREQSKDDSI